MKRRMGGVLPLLVALSLAGCASDGSGGPAGAAGPGTQPSAPGGSSGTVVPGGTVSGHWTLAGSPYKITGDIEVPNLGDGVVALTIDPGVKVEFQGRYSMRVRGGVHAVGTPSQRIRFVPTDADIARGEWNWTGWRGISIVGEPFHPPLHAHGVGLFDFRFCEIAYVEKAGGQVNVDPHDMWNGNFYAADVHPGELVFDDNWVHHAKMNPQGTGGGVLFWVSHCIDAPANSPDYYFHRNVFEDSQWNGVYFAHNHRANDGTLITAHLVGGAIRRTQRQASGSASVCTVFSTSAALDGVEVTDCGDRQGAPWFLVAAPPGTIAYTPPGAAAR